MIEGEVECVEWSGTQIARGDYCIRISCLLYCWGDVNLQVEQLMHPSNNEAHTLLFCKLFKLTSGCLYGVFNLLMNDYGRVVMVTNGCKNRPDITELEGFNHSNYLFWNLVCSCYLYISIQWYLLNINNLKISEKTLFKDY